MESVNYLIPSKSNSIESLNSNTKSGSDYNSSSSSLNISNPTLYFNPESLFYPRSVYNPTSHNSHSRSRTHSYSHTHSNSHTNSHQHIPAHSNNRKNSNYTYENHNEKRSFQNTISRNKINRNQSIDYNFDDDLPLENDINNGNSIKHFSILESAIKNNMVSSIEDNINYYSSNMVNERENRINEDIIEDVPQTKQSSEEIFNNSKKSIKVEVVSKDNKNELSKYSDKFSENDVLDGDYNEDGKNDEKRRGRERVRSRKKRERERQITNRSDDYSNTEIDSDGSLNRNNSKSVSIGSFNPSKSNNELNMLGNNHFTYHRHHHHIHHSLHDKGTNFHIEGNTIPESQIQHFQNQHKRLGSCNSDDQYRRNSSIENYISDHGEYHSRRHSSHGYGETDHRYNSRSRKSSVHDDNNDSQNIHHRRRSSNEYNGSDYEFHNEQRRKSSGEVNKNETKKYPRRYSGEEYNKHRKYYHDDYSPGSDNSRYGFHSHRSSFGSIHRIKEGIPSGNSIYSNDSDDHRHNYHNYHYNYRHGDSPSGSRSTHNHHYYSTSNSHNSIDNYYGHSTSNSRNNMTYYHHPHHNIHSHTSSRNSISPHDHYLNNGNGMSSNYYYHHHHHQQQQYQNNPYHSKSHHNYHHSRVTNNYDNNSSSFSCNSNNQTSGNLFNDYNNNYDSKNFNKNLNNNNNNNNNYNNNFDDNITINNNEVNNNQHRNIENSINNNTSLSKKSSVGIEKSIIINALNSIVSSSNGTQMDHITEMNLNSHYNSNNIDNEFPNYIRTAAGNIIVEICDNNDDDKRDGFVKIEEISDDEKENNLYNNNVEKKCLDNPEEGDSLIYGSINNESPLLMAINDGDDLDTLEKSETDDISTNEKASLENDIDDEIDTMRKSKSVPIKINIAMKNDIENILLYSPYCPFDPVLNKKLADDISERLKNDKKYIFPENSIFNDASLFNNIEIKNFDNTDFNILNKVKSFIPVSELKKRKNINCITLKGGFENKSSTENNSIVPFIRSSNMDIKNKKLDDLIKYPEHSYNSILNMKMFIFNELNDREKREKKANNFFIFNGEDEKDILTEDFNNTNIINKNENNEDELVSKRSENGPIDINDKGKYHSSSYDRRNESINKKNTHKTKKERYPYITNTNDSSISSYDSHHRNRSTHSSEESSLSNDKCRHCRHCLGNNKYHKYNSSNESNNYVNSRMSMNTNQYRNKKNRSASTTSALTSKPTVSRLLLNEGDSETGQNNGIYHHHRRHHHRRHHHHNHKSQHKKNNDLSSCGSIKKHYSSSNMSSYSNRRKNNMESSSDTNASYSSDTTSSSSIYTPSHNYKNNNTMDNKNLYSSVNSTNQNLSNLPKKSKISKKERELRSSSQLFSDFVPMECITNSKSSNINGNYNNSSGSSRNVSSNQLFNNDRGTSIFGFNSNMNVIPEVEVVKANVLSRVNVSEIPELTEQEEEELENEDDLFESRDFSEIYNPVINPSKVKAKSDIHLLNRYNSIQRFKGSINSASQFLHLPNLKNKVVSSPSKFETNYYTISYRKAIPKSEWKPDNSTNHCKICNKKFSFIKRRHHCRLCGYIFCYSCCQRMVPLIIDDDNTNSEKVKKYLHNMFNSNANCSNSQSSEKFKGSSASECLSSILELYQSKNNFMVCPIQCKICENCYTKYYIN